MACPTLVDTDLAMVSSGVLFRIINFASAKSPWSEAFPLPALSSTNFNSLTPFTGIRANLASVPNFISPLLYTSTPSAKILKITLELFCSGIFRSTPTYVSKYSKLAPARLYTISELACVPKPLANSLVTPFTSSLIGLLELALSLRTTL
ncbi:hypothetical protein D3C71_1271530 [compost metagenome]